MGQGEGDFAVQNDYHHSVIQEVTNHIVAFQLPSYFAPNKEVWKEGSAFRVLEQGSSL